jgi:hypothetical protein
LFIRLSKLAPQMGVSRRVVYQWARRGVMPGALELNGVWLVDVDIFNQWRDDLKKIWTTKSSVYTNDQKAPIGMRNPPSMDTPFASLQGSPEGRAIALALEKRRKAREGDEFKKAVTPRARKVPVDASKPASTAGPFSSPPLSTEGRAIALALEKRRKAREGDEFKKAVTTVVSLYQRPESPYWYAVASTDGHTVRFSTGVPRGPRNRARAEEAAAEEVGHRTGKLTNAVFVRKASRARERSREKPALLQAVPDLAPKR